MTDPRRNILLISLDDAFAYWKYRSAFGAELQTPNLDRICAVSTAFEAAYCQVPVCGPSRSSFMSALTPHELGIFDNYTNVFDVLRPEQMWPFRLKQDGYYTAAGGKVHHGYRPLPPAVHAALYSHPPETFTIGPGQKARVKDFGGMMRGQGTTDPAYDDRYYDAQSAASAAGFLETYAGDAPFYREVGFYHPHSPYKTPLRFKEMYDPASFHQPPAWAKGYDRNAFADLYMQENIDGGDLDLWRKSLRNYFSAFSHVDEHLGRVWDTLKASPHADSTVVVILADHGYHPGDRNRFRKFTLWEEAAGVPLIIHDPARPKGRVVSDPVALLDVGPTVLDYAGCTPIRHCVGRSLRPQVEGADVQGRAVPTFFYGSAAIRMGDYRYIRYQDGSRQMYDLTRDPGQQHDVSARHPMRETLHAALVDTCRDWGLDIREPGDATLRPAPYATAANAAAAPAHLPTDGIIAQGSLAPDDDSPRFRRHFATLAADGTIHLPGSIRAVYAATDFRIGIDHFGITGNDLGNLYDFVGGHNRFRVTIDCGTGDDTIRGHLDEMDVTLNAGDNRVVTGHTGATVRAGTGRDRIETANGTNILHGGSGNCDIVTGIGQDTVVTGPGTARILCTGGTTRIIVAAGRNRIEIAGGEVALVFHRTGLLQTVTGFTKGRIDLTDWQPLGPPTLTTTGGDVTLTAVTEAVRFIGADLAHIRQALAGGT